MGHALAKPADAVAPSRWPRLLSEADAAEYMSISPTTLRDLAIATKRIGRRKLYDVRDLDRFIDRMGDQPVPPAEVPEAAADEERRFFELRQKRRGRN